VPQCYLSHLKFHITWPGIDSEPPHWVAGDVLEGSEFDLVLLFLSRMINRSRDAFDIEININGCELLQTNIIVI
jgi:hypothetical protein